MQQKVDHILLAPSFISTAVDSDKIVERLAEATDDALAAR